MKLHILGIAGTFMGGLAVLAKQLGYEVQGCDANIYPPMSTQLEEQGIRLIEGYDIHQLDYSPDQIIVGNAMKRGNPIVEHLLNKGLAYTSGPQWLKENVLSNHWVLAVSGTHGKTTTSSMLAWILEYAGLNPGFLIGGVPENFGVSARLTQSKYFVIEADEYDSAFFDKRSKLIHYPARTAILNNLEYDHADIFPDLSAIQIQFHHWLRTLPSEGLIVLPEQDANLKTVIQKGCWTPLCELGKAWRFELKKPDASAFDIFHRDQKVGTVKWNLLGTHNAWNALAAIAASHHVGVKPEQAIEGLSQFKNVKRRLQIRGEVNQITVYDDFAHHPTAIATTLQGLRARVRKQRIIAIVELGSNTMRSGVHDTYIPESLKLADLAWLWLPQDANNSRLAEIINQQPKMKLFNQVDKIVEHAEKNLQPADHIVVMSNRGFDNIHEKLLKMISNKTVVV